MRQGTVYQVARMSATNRNVRARKIGLVALPMVNPLKVHSGFDCGRQGEHVVSPRTLLGRSGDTGRERHIPEIGSNSCAVDAI